MQPRLVAQQLHECGGIGRGPHDRDFGALELEALQRGVVGQNLGELVEDAQRLDAARQHFGQCLQLVGGLQQRFALADDTWRVAGDTPIERVEEQFGVELDPEPDGDLEVDFDTIGGLIAHRMGHVPKRGERHHVGGLEFLTLHTKGGAVRWFKVSRLPLDAQS